MKAFKLSIWGSLLFLMACSTDVPPSDLVRYVHQKDHGLIKSKTIGDLQFDLQYKPLDYLIAQELRTDELVEQAYADRLEDLKGLQYYNLRMSVPRLPQRNITNYQVYDDEAQQQRLYYLSFGFKEHLRLIQGRDTLRPVLYHFERSYDLAPHHTFVVAFKETDPDHTQDKTFVVDSPVWPTGPVKFRIRE
ncbi:MAG: hypothetical protein AAGD05_17130, partial [Bacteroidota bacterium]